MNGIGSDILSGLEEEGRRKKVKKAQRDLSGAYTPGPKLGGPGEPITYSDGDGAPTNLAQGLSGLRSPLMSKKAYPTGDAKSKAIAKLKGTYVPSYRDPYAKDDVRGRNHPDFVGGNSRPTPQQALEETSDMQKKLPMQPDKDTPSYKDFETESKKIAASVELGKPLGLRELYSRLDELVLTETLKETPAGDKASSLGRRPPGQERAELASKLKRDLAATYKARMGRAPSGDELQEFSRQAVKDRAFVLNQKMRDPNDPYAQKGSREDVALLQAYQDLGRGMVTRNEMALGQLPGDQAALRLSQQVSPLQFKMAQMDAQGATDLEKQEEVDRVRTAEAAGRPTGLKLPDSFYSPDETPVLDEGTRAFIGSRAAGFRGADETNEMLRGMRAETGSMAGRRDAERRMGGGDESIPEDGEGFRMGRPGSGGFDTRGLSPIEKAEQAQVADTYKRRDKWVKQLNATGTRETALKDYENLEKGLDSLVQRRVAQQVLSDPELKDAMGLAANDAMNVLDVTNSILGPRLSEALGTNVTKVNPFTLRGYMRDNGELYFPDFNVGTKEPSAIEAYKKVDAAKKKTTTEFKKRDDLVGQDVRYYLKNLDQYQKWAKDSAGFADYAGRKYEDSNPI